MRKSYPSDITKEQFEIIRKDLEQATKKTHPRKYDLYDIFCAILYLIKEGCSWRAIPHDFPKWENIRYHYDIWSKEDNDGISLLDRVLRKLVEAERREFDVTEKYSDNYEIKYVIPNAVRNLQKILRRCRSSE